MKPTLVLIAFSALVIASFAPATQVSAVSYGNGVMQGPGKCYAQGTNIRICAKVKLEAGTLLCLYLRAAVYVSFKAIVQVLSGNLLSATCQADVNVNAFSGLYSCLRDNYGVSTAVSVIANAGIGL